MNADPPTNDAPPDTAPPLTADIETVLHNKVEKWREKLLDLGNRNQLINCSFNPSRGAIELAYPECETIWRQLAADSEAGADPMRFPWRRELVPPPPPEEDEKEESAEPESDRLELAADPKVPSSQATTADPPTGDPKEQEKKPEPRKREEWNPPLQECLQSERLESIDLLTNLTDRQIDRRLRTLNSHAKLAMSEQGVHAVYVAFGFLKWYESPDSKDERYSPLMLVPVTLSRKATSAPWMVTEAEDDAIDNLCLRQRLLQDFSLELPPLPDINDLEEPGVRQQFLDAVRKSIAECERWEVQDRVVIGRFAFPKVAMWKDLGDHAGSVVAHALTRSIGGDTTVPPAAAFGRAEDLPTGFQLDDVIKPGEVKTILDSDSSQLEAVVAARKGVSFVLDGPPGTGKSQTIANIIADALSLGRTVLFVSEKVSALEVVKRRLDDRNLGDFCLECHSSKANRKSVLFELESCLELDAEVYDDAQPKLDEAKRKRDALNTYVRSVHRARSPLGLSPYELYGSVSRLTRAGLAAKSRCELPDPGGVDRATFDSWLAVLERAADCSDVIATNDSHPWRGCKLTSRSLSLGDDIKHHFEVLADAFGSIGECTRSLTDEGLLEPVSPGAIGPAQKLLKQSLTAPEVPELWFSDPAGMANAIVKKLTGTVSAGKLRAKLDHYSADAVDRFPEVDLDCLDADEGWSTRLTTPMPRLVREQLAVCTEVVRILSELSESANAIQTGLDQSVDLLELPIKRDLPTGALFKVAGLIAGISRTGPMREAWFESSQWDSITEAATTCQRKLRQVATIEDELTSRIEPENLDELAQVVSTSSGLSDCWGLVKPELSEGSQSEMERLVSQCDQVRTAGATLTESLNVACSTLGLPALSLTPSQCEQFASALRAISSNPMISGRWSAPATRVRIVEACKEAEA
jgi:hypothetical protein